LRRTEAEARAWCPQDAGVAVRNRNRGPSPVCRGDRRWCRLARTADHRIPALVPVPRNMQLNFAGIDGHSDESSQPRQWRPIVIPRTSFARGNESSTITSHGLPSVALLLGTPLAKPHAVAEAVPVVKHHAVALGLPLTLAKAAQKRGAGLRVAVNGGAELFGVQLLLHALGVVTMPASGDRSGWWPERRRDRPQPLRFLGRGWPSCLARRFPPRFRNRRESSSLRTTTGPS